MLYVVIACPLTDSKKKKKFIQIPIKLNCYYSKINIFDCSHLINIKNRSGLIACTRCHNIWEREKCAAINIALKFYLYFSEKNIYGEDLGKREKKKRGENDYLQNKICYLYKED